MEKNFAQYEEEIETGSKKESILPMSTPRSTFRKKNNRPNCKHAPKTMDCLNQQDKNPTAQAPQPASSEEKIMEEEEKQPKYRPKQKKGKGENTYEDKHTSFSTVSLNQTPQTRSKKN